MNFIKKLSILGATLLIGGCASAESGYKNSYAVVVNKSTYAEPAWKEVVDAVVAKRGAEVITYEGAVINSLEALKKSFPKYVCFVVKPKNAGFKHTVVTHRMMRQMDSDPYTDAIFSTITGYTPKDALQMVKATQPTKATTAVITAGVGAKRYKEAYYISTGKKGEHGHKTADGKIVKKDAGNADMTAQYVNYFETLDPDAIITSAHASQRNLEMPFSRGNIICKDGKLFGYSKGQMIDYSTGQAKKGAKPQSKLIPIKQPKNPKVYFAVGNCLIGDIPDKNCMALAFMGWGKGTQMIGYTATTWFGMVGWGTVKQWEQSGGYAPLNECFYFSNQKLMQKLQDQAPKVADLMFDYSKGMNMRQLQQDVVKAMKGTKISQKTFRSNFGMLWDRDVVAIYGDPAHEFYLDKEYTFKPSLTMKIVKIKDGLYKAVINSHVTCKTPKADPTPIARFMPERIKNIKILKGSEYKPIITDNFVMVTAPGPFEAGKEYEILFKADQIK